MANAPAFQLFASDFFMDTISWTAEEVGSFPLYRKGVVWFMDKKIYGIYTKKIPKSLKGGKWEYETFKCRVEIMSTVGKYSMVRRSGYYPFIAYENELTRNPKE
jgi:hypothetical protein